MRLCLCTNLFDEKTQTMIVSTISCTVKCSATFIVLDIQFCTFLHEKLCCFQTTTTECMQERSHSISISDVRENSTQMWISSSLELRFVKLLLIFFWFVSFQSTYIEWISAPWFIKRTIFSITPAAAALCIGCSPTEKKQTNEIHQ